MTDVSVVDSSDLFEILSSDKGQKIASELIDLIGIYMVDQCKERGETSADICASVAFWSAVFMPAIVGKILGTSAKVHIAATTAQVGLMMIPAMETMITDLAKGIDAGEFNEIGLWKRVLN